MEHIHTVIIDGEMNVLCDRRDVVDPVDSEGHDAVCVSCLQHKKNISGGVLRDFKMLSAEITHFVSIYQRTTMITLSLSTVSLTWK